MQKHYRIICLGLNKTGTSSLLNAFLKVLEWDWKSFTDDNSNAFKNKKRAYKFKSVKFISLYRRHEIDKLITEAATVPILKDQPWFKKSLYRKLYKSYPDSKFILTLRDPEDWYSSLHRWCRTFHLKDFQEKSTQGGEAMIIKRIKNKARSYNAHLGGKSIEDKEALIAGYNEYNNKIINYFKDKENFYILKVPEDLNWKTISNILNLTDLELSYLLNEESINFNLPIKDWEFPHTFNSTTFKQIVLPISKQIVYITK